MSADTVRTYRAEGWEDSAESLDYDRILAYATKHKQLPIRSEEQAVRVAEAAYGMSKGGPWIGQRRIGRLGNWRWLAGFHPSDARAAE